MTTGQKLKRMNEKLDAMKGMGNWSMNNGGEMNFGKEENVAKKPEKYRLCPPIVYV